MSEPATPMRVLAPAKINLHLRVGPRGPDGFHALRSWMCTVALFDTLTITPAGRIGPSTAEGMVSPPSQAGGKSGCADPPGTCPGPRDESEARGHAAPRGREAEAGEVGDEAGEIASGLATASLSCDLPGLPCDQTNLVARAVAGFAAALAVAPSGRSDPARSGMAPEGTPGVARGREGGGTAVAPQGKTDSAVRRPGPADRASAGPAPVAVAIALAKQIPVGAGLGGGSSDAARTLVALNRLWRAGRTAGELSALAARLGSDVPFFVHATWPTPPASGAAVCAGRGEIVRPAPPPAAARWAVLLLPPVGMPTAQVYRRFDETGSGREEDVAHEPPIGLWAALGAGALLPLLVNDLEPAAFAIEPKLDRLRRDAEQQLGRPVRMSGSGSSLFTLYDARGDADAAAEMMTRRFGTAGVRATAVEVAPTIRDDLMSDSAQS